MIRTYTWLGHFSYSPKFGTETNETPVDFDKGSHIMLSICHCDEKYANLEENSHENCYF
jgi:hypothetical protein